MFDMTNDSHLFRTADELRRDGAYEVAGRRFEKGSQAWVPLFEGKMVQSYDHRAASVVVNPSNLNRPAQPEPTTEAQHSKPDWLSQPQFFVDQNDVPEDARFRWLISYKMISAPTNMRTMIASVIPGCGVGNSMGLMLPETPNGFGLKGPLLVSTINSAAFDYVLRQKIQGQNINWYILEQLPFIPEPAYARAFGPRTAQEIVQDDVLHLTYVSNDMAPFAQDMGYAGPPFAWDPEDRLRRRARIDAVYFHLYGLDRDDAAYVMETFPIVAAQEKALYKSYRSRALVLAYMAALDAGAPDAPVTG